MNGVEKMRSEDLAAAVEASGLTKAQFTALWNARSKEPPFLAPHDGWRRAGHAMSGLIAKGLAERVPVKGAKQWHYRLTDRGLSLAATSQAREGEGE